MRGVKYDMIKKSISLIVIMLIAVGYFSLNSYIKIQIDAGVQKKLDALPMNQPLDAVESGYNNGVSALKNGYFDTARKYLQDFSDGKYNEDNKYKDAQILFLYADACVKKETFYHAISKIPKNYNGQFATEINDLNNK